MRRTRGAGLIPLDANKKPLVAWRSAPLGEPISPRVRRLAVMWARIIPEGEVVLDLDDGRDPPGDWPGTAELWTPRGVHLWYRTALQMTKSIRMVDGRKVDICPSGTLEIVAGPGRHFVQAPIAELPDWLGEALAPKRQERRALAAWADQQRRVGGGSHVSAARMRRAEDIDLDTKIGDVSRPQGGNRYVRAAMDNLFWLVATAPEGRRTIMLNQAAYRCGELGVPFDKAEGMLTRAAIRCGLDTDDGTDIQAVIRCGFEAGSQATPK